MNSVRPRRCANSRLPPENRKLAEPTSPSACSERIAATSPRSTSPASSMCVSTNAHSRSLSVVPSISASRSLEQRATMHRRSRTVPLCGRTRTGRGGTGAWLRSETRPRRPCAARTCAGSGAGSRACRRARRTARSSASARRSSGDAGSSHRRVRSATCPSHPCAPRTARAGCARRVAQQRLRSGVTGFPGYESPAFDT